MDDVEIGQRIKSRASSRRVADNRGAGPPTVPCVVLRTATSAPESCRDPRPKARRELRRGTARSTKSIAMIRASSTRAASRAVARRKPTSSLVDANGIESGRASDLSVARRATSTRAASRSVASRQPRVESAHRAPSLVDADGVESSHASKADGETRQCERRRENGRASKADVEPRQRGRRRE